MRSRTVCYVSNRHQCDVCNDWTSDTELIDQILDTRLFSFNRNSLGPSYFTYNDSNSDIPISICPRCIVQGACIIEATIGDNPCDHSACWPDDDYTFFDGLEN
jgi:hypothetical protein